MKKEKIEIINEILKTYGEYELMKVLKFLDTIKVQEEDDDFWK